MKAMVTLNRITRGEKNDSVKFIDDATGELPPVVELRGGEKDGEKFTPRALRYDKEAGRIIVRSGNEVVLEMQGEIQRTDSWTVNEETGQIEATASLTFTGSGHFTDEEVKGLWGAKDGLAITFKPTQKAFEFKKGQKANAA